MKKTSALFLVVLFCFPLLISAQIPTNTLVNIVKAEDARRWDAVLENLLNSPDSKIRQRVALAAGRIGDENAIPALAKHLQDDEEVQTIIMFALGEIESAKASPAVLEILNDTKKSGNVRARAIEAAGKIAAANPKDAQTAELGKAIVSALQSELAKRATPGNETVLLGMTAVLRARPEGGEAITAKFLDYPDARIRADALNTLARLRSKTINEKARELLAKDTDPIVRANAARILGGTEDKTALDLLLNEATNDADLRVRVSAIRSLVAFKDTKTSDTLLSRAEMLLAKYKASKYEKPNETTELLEIVTILGRVLENSSDARAINFLKAFRERDKYESPETEIAFAKIAPQVYVKELNQSFSSGSKVYPSWRRISSIMQGLVEISKLPDDKSAFRRIAAITVSSFLIFQPSNDISLSQSLPDILRTLVAFKKDIDLPSLPPPVGKITNNEYLSQFLRGFVKYRDKSLPPEKSYFGFNSDSGYFDPIVRATAAQLLSELPPTKENIEALKAAFVESLLVDKTETDAQLAILNALYKLDKKESLSTLLLALNAPDYLVRQNAIRLIKAGDFAKDSPGIPAMLASAKTTLQPYAPSTGAKLGQILNTNTDYVRAVSRKNGSVKALFTTSKGNFTIDFYPEDAPLTVDNFVKLARSNYFNGVSVHRVVANFVMQDGDPRGDGNGSPGYQIRCELNMLPYERGAVGMALSGKDTGGSQWFVTHSPAPHLDGGYTVFGEVNENDMKIVDNIVRGDKIISVKIIEGNAPPKTIRRSVKR